MTYAVIDRGLNNAVVDGDGSVLFITDLKRSDSWECRRCGKCCSGVNCLKYDNGCTDYPNRPLVCKLFPLSIIHSGRLEFIKSPYCPGWGAGKNVDFDSWVSLMHDCYLELRNNPNLFSEWVSFFNRK